jgi:hypothetical protein
MLRGPFYLIGVLIIVTVRLRFVPVQDLALQTKKRHQGQQGNSEH